MSSGKPYTDQQMAAFTQMAYWEDLNDIVQAKGSPVYVKDLMSDPAKLYSLEKIGFTKEQIENSGWQIVDTYDTNAKNGFACCTIQTSDGHAVIAYRGSEGFETDLGNGINDWVRADLGLVNSVQTSQHAEVERFLDSRKGLLSQYSLAMTGHSLGGNLAEYGTIVSGKYGLDGNVEQCLSMDGPGFSDEFASKYANEIARMSDRMEHLQWSPVGNLLTGLPGVEQRIGSVENKGDDEYGMMTRHDPKYLQFDSDGSVKPGSVDPLALILGGTSKWIDNMDPDKGNIIKTGLQGAALLYFMYANRDHLWEQLGDWFKAQFTDAPQKSGGGGGHGFSGGGGGGGGGHGFGGGKANVIRVSTEDMARTISKYQEERGRLMDALGICNNAAQELARSWAGPSFLAMSVRLSGTYKNLSQSLEKIDDAIDELKSTINIMDSAESSVASAAAALDIGSSPFA